MEVLTILAGFVSALSFIYLFSCILLCCIACSTRNTESTGEIAMETASRRIIDTGLNAAPTPSAANARGLDDDTRIKCCSELTVVEMNENGDAASCSICLEEYDAKKKIRQINSCQHRFHADCVDHWFLKNTTCPICRVSLLDDKL